MGHEDFYSLNNDEKLGADLYSLTPSTENVVP